MMPRWSGRSGCRSTFGGGNPSSRRDRLMAATTPGSPPHGRVHEMGDRQDLRGGHRRQRVLR
jgi:hypothetical protein